MQGEKAGLHLLNHFLFNSRNAVLLRRNCDFLVLPKLHELGTCMGKEGYFKFVVSLRPGAWRRAMSNKIISTT